MKAHIVYPQGEAIITREKSIAGTQVKAAARLVFVDNIRIFLTILVVLHHLLIIYTGAGGWPYKEGREDLISAVLGKWITSVNGAYFMGLFLFIAAYFVPGSYDRKGAFQFIKDRLIRLGIPLAVYCWMIRPVLLYAGKAGFGEMSQSFLAWYFQGYFKEYGLVSGPLWFIEALLIFSILYALWRKLAPKTGGISNSLADFPSNAWIALFALGITIASFLVRLWSPSDQVFWPLSFQLADFPQYIALFVAGLIAYRQDWLVRVPEKTGRMWMLIAVILILVYPPVVFLAGALTDATPFLGGWHWQAMLGATWQSFVGVAMCLSVIYLFKRRLDRQNRLGHFLSHNAYTVYLIHEPVIILVALLAMGLMIYPLLKFLLVGLVAVPLCYGLSSLVRRLPFTERVL